jgi:hypothetical protein
VYISVGLQKNDEMRVKRGRERDMRAKGAFIDAGWGGKSCFPGGLGGFPQERNLSPLQRE